MTLEVDVLEKLVYSVPTLLASFSLYLQIRFIRFIILYN